MNYFISACLLFFSCVAVCAGHETGDVLDLTTEHPAAVLLTPEHGSTLRLVLCSSQAEEIILYAAVPDISYRIITSDGTEIRSASIGTLGWITVPFRIPGNANSSREIWLELKTQNRVEGLPGLQVHAELRPIPLKAFEEYQRAAWSFNTAQKLHRSLRSEDLRQAIVQFQQAAMEWAGVGDLYGEALALGGKSESEIELSQYVSAQRVLDRALGLTGNNAYLRGWLFHLAARVYLDQWEPEPAKGFAEQVLRLGQEINDAALIALAQTDLAGVAYWNGDVQANEIADRAHDEAVLAGMPETLALERRWKAWLKENDEQDAQAIALMGEAELHFQQAGDLRTAIEATGQVAQAMNLNGDLYSGLAKLLELEPFAKTIGNSLDYGILLENIGTLYVELGKPRYGEMYFHQAERAYAKAHFQHGLMLINGSLCETGLSLNENASTVADCKISLNIAKKTRDPVFIGIAQCQLGLANRKAGRLTQAFADFTEAARNSRIGGDLRRESQERIQLGELLEWDGKHREALNEIQQAKSLSQGVADSSSLLEARYAVARWYEQDGQYRKAEEEMAPAIQQLELARQMVADKTLQASFFAAKRKCYELAMELRMREFERNPTGEGDALALDLSEQSRGRSLLDALYARSKADKRDRNDDQTGLMHSNIAVDRAFDRRLKLLVEGGTKRDLDSSSAQLMRTLNDLEQADNKIHADATNAPKPTPTMSTAEIQQASFGSGTAFFEYALGPERSHLWVIDGGKRKSYVLPPRAQLENMVKLWRTLATSQVREGANASAKLQHLSVRLSCALLANAVEASMTKMVIVPDGELAMLPFAALPENGCSSARGKPLVVGHEITLTPSLSVFLSRKSIADNKTFQGKIAIIADPVFDVADPRAIALKIGTHKAGFQSEPASGTKAELPRLVNTGYEASAIQATVRQAVGDAQVFLAQGFDASVETVLSPTIQDYRIWHLATHGVYDESVPEFSGLVFSLLDRNGNAQSGFLKAHDIAQLSVRAELVVLSACDSTAGENVNGEGIIGLSYAFLHAGAKEVISTLWSVDDAKSKDLIIAFYKELMHNGGNAPAALRQSQLNVMHQPGNSAPYYWAGFELTSVGQ